MMGRAVIAAASVLLVAVILVVTLSCQSALASGTVVNEGTYPVTVQLLDAEGNDLSGTEIDINDLESEGFYLSVTSSYEHIYNGYEIRLYDEDGAKNQTGTSLSGYLRINFSPVETTRSYYSDDGTLLFSWYHNSETGESSYKGKYADLGYGPELDNTLDASGYETVNVLTRFTFNTETLESGSKYYLYVKMDTANGTSTDDYPIFLYSFTVGSDDTDSSGDSSTNSSSDSSSGSSSRLSSSTGSGTSGAGFASGASASSGSGSSQGAISGDDVAKGVSSSSSGSKSSESDSDSASGRGSGDSYVVASSMTSGGGNSTGGSQAGSGDSSTGSSSHELVAYSYPESVASGGSLSMPETFVLTGVQWGFVTLVTLLVLLIVVPLMTRGRELSRRDLRSRLY
jgi:hypothetical protein